MKRFFVALILKHIVFYLPIKNIVIIILEKVKHNLSPSVSLPKKGLHLLGSVSSFLVGFLAGVSICFFFFLGGGEAAFLVDFCF